MPFFITTLAGKYDPHDIDYNLFTMYYPATRCVPVLCTKKVVRYGVATVNGKKIDSGKCVKLFQSPLPVLFLPVGQQADEFGKTYTVKLSGYEGEGGSKFPTVTFKVKTPAPRTDDGRHKENELTAKRVADEGIVLLQNDGVLPLKKGERVTLCGDYKNFRITETGASLIKPRWTLTIPEAMKKAGFSLVDGAETALFFISRGSAENRDNMPVKGGYYLTDEEMSGLEKAVASHKNVILVFSTGYPVEMKRILESGVKAMLWTGFSGQRGAESLADILCGDVCPSGRLADSWPLDYYDLPASHNFINLDENSPIYTDDARYTGARVYYEEKQYVGYRYFTSFGKQPAFLFGHGLSYAEFERKASCFFDGKTLSVECSVKNAGGVRGKTSLLVYVKPPKGALDKPAYCFCGFAKTEELDGKEEQTLKILIPAKDFSCYDDAAHAFVLEKGDYEVLVGGSLKFAAPAGTFSLAEDLTVQKTISVCAPCEKVGSIDEKGNVEKRTVMVKPKECIAVPAKYQKAARRQLCKSGGKLTFADVCADMSKLDDFVARLFVRELIRFAVCNGSCWYPGGSGAAGKLGRNKRLGIPRRYMSDGNCGVNLYRRTTGFPSSNMLASTFNKQLAYEVGKVLALESAENGIAVNLGPGGNLHRNILCGRNAEYFSEDPILAGTLMGWQAKGEEENGVLATYKHLFANQMEFERKAAHSVIDERTVRELYLRVFDKAFDVYKPACVMTSYNPVNGIYPCENAALLNDLLRGEWGFDGFVMTDWESYTTSDPIKSLNAGTDLLTPGGGKYYRRVRRAVAKGEIDKATLQNAAKNVIKVLIRYENLSNNKAR